MSSFIADLKQQLPPIDWPIVVAALRNESNLWEDFQDQSFCRQALEAAGSTRDHWSPAFLGLLSLGQVEQFNILRSAPMQPVPESLRYRAASAYEQLASDSSGLESTLPDLERATLLALALRERRRLLNGWEQLPGDLSIAPKGFWKLPLAILFGLIPTPQELLGRLISPDQDASVHLLGLHSLLTNPLPVDQQSVHLLETIRDFHLPELLTLLRELAQLSTPLAKQAALHALENMHGVGGSISTDLSKIEELLLRAEIHQISGQGEEAKPLLNSAWEASQQFQADLAARLADSTDEIPSLESLHELTKMAEAAHTQNGPVSFTQKRPSALLSAARVALKSGDHREAETLARATLESAQKTEGKPGLESAKLFKHIAEIFIQLGFNNEALIAARLAAEAGPNDAESAAFLAKSFLNNGEIGKALEGAHLAAALAPESSEHRRSLAKMLQLNAKYVEAVEEWESYLKLSPNSGIDDVISLAECALAAAKSDVCIQACQKAISLDSTGSKPYSLIGQALILQGDEESAKSHLGRATELAPSETGAWLALAGLHRDKGDLETALDLLTKAQHVSKPTAQFYELLADIYRQLEQPAKAESAYRQAKELALSLGNGELDLQISLRLGELQHQMGAVDRAYETLHQAHNAYPGHAAIAHAFARVLLKREETKRALGALQIAAQGLPHDVFVMLDLARAYLADSQPEPAERVLRQLFSTKDVPAAAHALLAEALAAREKHSEAIKEYSRALKSELSSDPIWQKNLTLGKAASQASSGEIIPAIKTIEGMLETMGDDLDVLKALCSVYVKANRRGDALKLAQKVYQASREDEQTILWYAEQAQGLGQSDTAQNALNDALEAGVQSPSVIRLLAELQWPVDSGKSSLRTFSKLLKSAGKLELIEAGRFILAKGLARESLPYFERAMQMSESADAELLNDIGLASKKIGQWDKALAAFEQIISLTPHDSAAMIEKTEILQQMGRPQAALETLERALSLAPENSTLLASKARLLARVQDWETALAAAEKAITAGEQSAEFKRFAAELALTAMQPERARRLINTTTVDDNSSLEIIYLSAELALSSNEELEAAKALSTALQGGELHSRVLSLQSRLAFRHYDFAQAEDRLTKAIAQLTNDSDPFTVLGVSQAAQDLNHWGVAIDLLHKLTARYPNLPLAQLRLGKAIVQGAEWEQLLEASGAKSAEGQIAALPKEGFAQCMAALEAASRSVTAASVQNQISRWKARAGLRMAPAPDLNALPSNYPTNGEEAAALVFAGRCTNQIPFADKLCKTHLNEPETLIERALAPQERADQSSSGLIEQAAEAFHHSAPVQAIAARIASAAGEKEIAIRRISRALALWPSQANWHALAADIQRTAGAIGVAIEHLRQAILLDPEAPNHYYSLGQHLLAINAFGEATLSLQKAADLKPNESKYHLALAESRLKAGELKEAEKSARVAQKLSPRTSGALLIQAEAALSKQDAKQARSFAEEALKINPEDPRALSIFAEALNSLGLVDDALEVLERARTMAEDGIPYLIRKAQLLHETEGLETLIKLSQRFPNRADVFFALSEMLASAGNLRGSIQAAQRATKKAGDLLNVDISARLHLHLGKLLKQDGQLDQSLQLLDDAIRMAPFLLEAHLERGRVFLARRQFENAMRAYQQAAEISPQNMKPFVEMGLALKEAKDYSGAEANLRKAAHLAPNDRLVHRQLAAVIALNMVHKSQEAGVLQ